MKKRVVQLLRGVCLLFLLCTACSQKDKPKKVSYQSIYDHDCFRNLWAQTMEKEDLFSHFKQDPLFNFFFENLSYEEGERLSQTLARQYPHLMERLDVFRANDQIGDPRTYVFDQVGRFSPTTLRYIAIGGQLQGAFGDLSTLDVVQVGAGYGGLCHVLHCLSTFKSFTMIDFPPQLEFAKKYLKRCGVEGVLFQPIDQICEGISCDLVISDLTFAEFHQELQERMIQQLAAKVPSGLLIGYQFPKHYGLDSLTPEQVEKKLQKWHPNVRLGKKEFSPKNNYYYLQWCAGRDSNADF